MEQLNHGKVSSLHFRSAMLKDVGKKFGFNLKYTYIKDDSKQIRVFYMEQMKIFITNMNQNIHKADGNMKDPLKE